METATLDDKLDQMDLIDIYRTSHPKAAAQSFFSRAHETVSKTDHMLEHKINLNKFKNT